MICLKIKSSLFALKLLGCVTLYLLPIIGLAQEKEIVSVLNRELKNEIRRQKNDPENYPGIRFAFLRPYHIDAQTISISVRKKGNDNLYYTEKQEVALEKISAIVKDINVIFETEPDAVTVTTTIGNKVTTRRSDLFFLYLSSEKQNEKLADKLVQLFQKTGYTITKGHWYD